ncbi:MAG TPA: FAD-dependent oxidoreductase, partial [Candidatus Obscuribacterales bacterium]
PEGWYAAARAAQLGARVAWVLQGLPGQRWALSLPGAAPPMPHHQALQRAQTLAEALTRDNVPQLMAQGVDVIAAQGQVVGDRPLTVTTPDRRLTARALLLATGSRAQVPVVPDLAAFQPITPAALRQQSSLPPAAVVMGGTPAGITLCQWLRRWQVPVTLIVPRAALLPAADPAVNQWLTAQLRATGVDLRVGHPVTAIAATDAAIQQQLKQGAALVIDAPPVPHLTGLGLEPWLPSDRPPAVNAFLQTVHPRIFACGSVLGGLDDPAIARQEAHCAVHNALFWPQQRIDYRVIPYGLATTPLLAQVGLTTPQARQRYRAAAVLVARQSWYDNPKAQWQDATVGFCQLIAHRNGQLLGVHGVGPAADEWVQTAALLMAQRTPWWQLADAATQPHTFTEILRQAAQQWAGDRWRPGRWRRDWAENWCNWRRN